jgi:hypothetical protein
MNSWYAIDGSGRYLVEVEDADGPDVLFVRVLDRRH